MHDNMNGDVLTNWLAIVGVVSLIYWAWRIVAALGQRRSPRQVTPAGVDAVPTQPAEGTIQSTTALPSGEDIAAITAAIYAVLGGHRIVHLEPAGTTPTWSVEGRMMQQSSHTPR